MRYKKITQEVEWKSLLWSDESKLDSFGLMIDKALSVYSCKTFFSITMMQTINAVKAHQERDKRTVQHYESWLMLRTLKFSPQ